MSLGLVRIWVNNLFNPSDPTRSTTYISLFYYP